MSFGNFCRRNKLAIAITGTSTTLGIILAASGIGVIGALFILGGAVGVGYLIYRSTN
jgi:hypothetical protein